jgi:hypothetical protein
MAGDPLRCDCPCHGNPMIQHFVACCGACPRCGARFQKGLAAHERGCDGTPPAPREEGAPAAT